jgi:hypothetical protein
MEMLMYSEAKFHLGDMDEARKGYNIVTIYFPNSIESSMAKKRLDEIAGVQKQKNVKDRQTRLLWKFPATVPLMREDTDFRKWR